jgi:LysM repeat protein
MQFNNLPRKPRLHKPPLHLVGRPMRPQLPLQRWLEQRTGITPTNANTIATTAVAIIATVTPGGPTSVPLVRPQTYVLQKDEFPYCIARRYNVDPQKLIQLSGLTNPDIYYEGLKLTIPQTGSWPGSAALLNHPATYTVTGNADSTVYGVACKYGNVDPAAIASANGITVTAKLTIGQKLNIP